MHDDPSAVTAEAFLDDERAGFTDLSVLAHVARGMHVPSGELGDTLDAIVRSATRALPGADDAGLIVVARDQLEPVAATSARPKLLDELQRKVRQGPCFEAATSQQVVLVTDLRRDARWSALHEAAAELGVASMACVPLLVGTRMTGALTLYSAQVETFDAVDLGLLELFATLAAISLAEAQRTDQLRTALASRDVLGQAKGILMERQRVGADDAFRLLSQASQATNVKVTVVAEHLVSTGELLEPGSRAR